MEIKEKSFSIIVKAGSSKSEVTGFDNERNAYRVNIKAKAEANKANIEVIRLFSRITGRRARIVKGLRSKEKIIRAED